MAQIIHFADSLIYHVMVFQKTADKVLFPTFSYKIEGEREREKRISQNEPRPLMKLPPMNVFYRVLLINKSPIAQYFITLHLYDHR